MTVDLKGSEKQIAWAEEIRGKWVNEGHEIIEQNLIDAVIPATMPEYRDKIIEAVRNIKTISDAKWWIDNRAYLQVHSGNYADFHKNEAKMIIMVAAKHLGMV